MSLLPEIAHWVSTRNFTDEPVARDSLERILDAGRRAPSAKNRQPWRFIVIQAPEIRKKIADAAFGQEHVEEAPLIIAGCTTNVDYKMPNGQLSYPIDISFAMSFMMLQAQHEGLGTCIVTTYDEREIRELLTVPFSMRVVMLLVMGHPSEKTEQKPRNPLDRIVSYDHW